MSDPIRAWALVWADGDLCRITTYEGDAIASARSVGLNIIPLVECTEHRRALTRIAELERELATAREHHDEGNRIWRDEQDKWIAHATAAETKLAETQEQIQCYINETTHAEQRILDLETSLGCETERANKAETALAAEQERRERELCQTTDKTCNNCAEPYRYSKALKSNEPMIQVCRHAHRGNWSVCSKWKEQNEKSST